MAVALLNVFDANVVFNILAMVPPDEPEISTLYGVTQIFGSKHYVTYGGGPEGGFVYLPRSRKPGWYKWHRDWFQKPRYTYIEKGQVAFLIQPDGSEEMAILPANWENTVDLEELAEIVIVADEGFMEENP